MKKFLHLVSFIAAFGFLASCGDSHEKLAKDQIDYLEEMTVIINGVADGELSSNEASEQIAKWGRKGGEIKNRKQAFIDSNEAEEFDAVAQKHAEETMKATRDLMVAMQELQESGRLTKEIQEAMENVKE